MAVSASHVSALSGALPVRLGSKPDELADVALSLAGAGPPPGRRTCLSDAEVEARQRFKLANLKLLTAAAAMARDSERSWCTMTRMMRHDRVLAPPPGSRRRRARELMQY